MPEENGAVASEKILVDGEELGIEEIRNLKETSKNTLRDYHKKMESVAAEREAITSKGQALTAEHEKLLTAREAMAKDVMFYQTHPVEEWNGYVPEFDKVTGRASPTAGNSSSSALPPEQVKKIERLEGDLKEMRQERVLEKVNTARASIDRLVAEKYKNADVDACKDRLYVLLDSKGVIPSSGEIEEIVKASHSKGSRIKEDAVKEAAKAAEASLREKAGASSGSLSIPSMKGGGGGKDLGGKELPRLDDIDGIVQRGREFMGKRAEKRAG